MTIDKTTFLMGVLIGIIIGMVVAALILFYGFSEIGNSIHIQNMAINSSINFPLNETRIIESINRSMIK